MEQVLEALLESYGRNNTILLNLLQALPEGGLEARALEGSPTIAEQYSHIQQARLFWLNQVAPEFATGVTQLFHKDGEDWLAERDPARIEQALNQGVRAVGEAVQDRLHTGQAMRGEHASYDHPILLLQHLLWHEGYHVGQIKLALKAFGYVMPEEMEEKAIWSQWRTETW
ncbi:MAG: DinB family protein [Meiothermus sp.]|nr:DinB family protein [Meiothermus sp.]